MGTFTTTIMRMLDSLVNAQKLLPYTGEWVPEDHRDRLRQYEVFRALSENRFGALLKNPEAAKKLRGYGDYALIVETSRDAVIGDRIEIEVPGSSDEKNTGAIARKKFLDEWARKERWASKVFRAETDAAAVGDCVYELRPDGQRLRLRTHDPESFFPVWENADGDFHQAYLAWEELNTGQYLETEPANLTDVRNKDGEVVLYRRHYEVITRAQAVERKVKLAGAETRKSICVVSAGWYRIEVKGQQKAPGFKFLALLGSELLDDGTPIIDLDTGFDTVPLFYVPNREATAQPWGLPEGESVLQLLLDASQDQADLKDNTFHNAFPVMYDEMDTVAPTPRPGANQPATPSSEKYRPGTIYNRRKLGVVDLSNGNKILIEHEDYLISKALCNSRTTMIAAGKMEVGEIPSGIALMIALLPLLAKTLPKRTTRRDKLGMLLKYVMRWHREFGAPEDFFSAAGDATEQSQRTKSAWPAGIWDSEEAYPSFGSIIPIDKKQVSEMVRDLDDKISDETAVNMLVMAGFPIDDAAEEVKRLADARKPTAGAPGSGLGNEGRVIEIPGVTA